MAGKDPLILGGLCDRAREWASLRLDGELSPPRGALERHLDACGDCRAFEDDVRWATDVLRLTPQERPRAASPCRPAPPRRVTGRRLTAIAATAALAAGALIGSVVERPSSQAPANGPTEVSLLPDEAKQLRDLPRTRLLSPAPAPAPPPNPPEGVI